MAHIVVRGRSREVYLVAKMSVMKHEPLSVDHFEWTLVDRC